MIDRLFRFFTQNTARSQAQTFAPVTSGLADYNKIVSKHYESKNFGDMNANFLYAYDGDTITVGFQYMPDQYPLFHEMKIRVLGIDTPEISGKTRREKALAEEARNFTQNFCCSAEYITLLSCAWDKYGGRIIASVVADGKFDLGTELIKKGLAKPYSGKGPKPKW